MFSKILKLIPWLLAAFLLLRIINLQDSNSKLKEQAANLQSDLKNKTTIYKDKVIYVYRDNEDKAKQKEVYVPPSGKVEIIKPKDNENIKQNIIEKITTEVIETDDSYIVIKDKGLSFRPEISSFYTDKLEIGLQFGLVYYKRYEFGLGISNEETVYCHLGRTISDIIPNFKNTSIQIIFGQNFKDNNKKIGFGFNVGF